jgi:predicted nucleic acid-binding Zn ribbon protein
MELLMPTYVYQTIGAGPSGEPRRFEQFQKMNDQALTHDPDTGLPVQRVITGGIGVRRNGLKRTTVVNKKSAAATACGCVTGCTHR